MELNWLSNSNMVPPLMSKRETGECWDWTAPKWASYILLACIATVSPVVLEEGYMQHILEAAVIRFFCFSLFLHLLRLYAQGHLQWQAGFETPQMLAALPIHCLIDMVSWGVVSWLLQSWQWILTNIPALPYHGSLCLWEKDRGFNCDYKCYRTWWQFSVYNMGCRYAQSFPNTFGYYIIFFSFSHLLFFLFTLKRTRGFIIHPY